MARKDQFAGTLVMVLLVTGCTADGVPGNAPPSGYVPDRWERVAAADWSQAQSVTVVLRDSHCQPEKLDLRRDVPYRLNFENQSSSPRFFRSEGFFKAIAVKSLRPAWRTANTSALTRLDFALGGWKALDFVAVKPGTYEVQCGAMLRDVIASAKQEIIIR